MGNTKGGLVMPYRVATYTTKTTGRSHWFDLDTNTWKRLSTNRTNSAIVPSCAYDERRQRLWHRYGWLDLDTMTHTTYGMIVNNLQSTWCFDPTRDMLLALDHQGGGVARLARFNMNDGLQPNWGFLNLSGDSIPVGTGLSGGLCFCPDQDCFYAYKNDDNQDNGEPMVVYRISPPGKTVKLTANWNVTRIALASTDGKVIPRDGTAGGTFKRFQWNHKLKCLMYWGSARNTGGLTGKVWLINPGSL
jgi:hypothetical protein